VRTFSGFWPALITPYTADDRINVTVLRELVDYLLAKGVSGLYLCGSTGEGAFLTAEERRLVVETVMQRVAGRVPLIVHVGAAVLNDSVALARHAQEVGAAGISSILPPVIYDGRGVVPFFERIAAAAPELPFLPYLFGYTRDAVALIQDLAHIPNLAGTKYTAPNMYEMSQLIQFRQSGWTVFSGMDEQAVLGQMYGAAGMIGSTLNYMPGAYRCIYELCHEGNYAAANEVQQRVNVVTQLFIKTGFVGAFREAMKLIGFDCGTPRVPNLPLAAEQVKPLHEALKATDFAELVAL
jgi:N-acetylneuraminate lyase